MKIKFTRRDVWWVVTQERRGEAFTFAFIWPMVSYWLADQIGAPPQDVFVQWYSLTKWKEWMVR